MLRSSPNHRGTVRRRLVSVLLAIAACFLVTTGCTAWSRPNYDYSAVGEVEQSAQNEWDSLFRRSTNSTDPFAVTNQGMEIERRLGVQ